MQSIIVYIQKNKIQVSDSQQSPSFSFQNFVKLKPELELNLSPIFKDIDHENTVFVQIFPKKNESLAQSIYLSGLIEPRALCAGIGRCGLCKVRYLSEHPATQKAEQKVLSPTELEQGWRLSCIRNISQELEAIDELFLLLPTKTKLLNAVLDFESEPSAHHTTKIIANNSSKTGLAIDLGTSSVHWSSINTSPNSSADSSAAEPQAKSLEAGTFINPQMGAGADVISRLAHAAKIEDRARLQDLTLQSFKNIISKLQTKPSEIVLAANSAMTFIALNKDPAGLSHSPYKLNYFGGCTELIDGLPPIWVAPLLTPFVGGDISAGVAALSFGAEHNILNYPPPNYPFMLADLGTNGEFALCLSQKETIITSVPMGPALEGIGLSCGIMASQDAVSNFNLSPQGLEAQSLKTSLTKNQSQEFFSINSSEQSTGLTATAYLSLINHLLKVGILNQDGIFQENSQNMFAKKILFQMGQKRLVYSEEQGAKLLLPHNFYLSAEDIEEILKVKAAFTLAVQSLLGAARIEFRHLKNFFVAGSLGKHIKLDNLETLGFLPSGAALQAKSIGNSSLQGCELFLKAPKTREQILKWSETVTHLELTNTPDFTDLYLKHMNFSFYS